MYQLEYLLITKCANQNKIMIYSKLNKIYWQYQEPESVCFYEISVRFRTKSGEIISAFLVLWFFSLRRVFFLPLPQRLVLQQPFQ
jgi:hypothetical protein